MQVAVFGLGKMGLQIAKRLHKNGFSVLAWNRGEEPRAEFEAYTKEVPGQSQSFESLDELNKNFDSSDRVFWIMLPQNVVHDFIFGDAGIKNFLKPGDIVIDGGNSFYKESMKNASLLKASSIEFYDCGTSGGVWGFEKGFALMVGGSKDKWPVVEPIFKALSGGENYGLVGENGAGHFVKMVHNGIEYGMMEAIAEGYGIMRASSLNLDLLQVTKVYQQGTVIRSWLIDLVRNIFENEDIEATVGEIGMLGEGEWTVQTAKELGVDARVLEASVKVREESKDLKNQNKFSNKIVALLRKQFGGHGVIKK